MEHADANLAAGSGEPFRLKAAPIALTVALGIGILLLSQIAVELIEHFTHLPERPQMPWIGETYTHFAQLALALGVIHLLRRRHPGTYGLQWPEGKAYVVDAILWGLFFGLAMTLIDYWPQIFAHKPPTDKPYPLTTLNVWGWFSFEGILVGPSEEVLFRGLLVTFLMQRMPGTVAYRGYSMSGAGIVVAFLFALAHVGNFALEPFGMALGQQVYAFVMGVFYAYWYEKSKSLLAPVIGHGLSDLTEYVLIFLMVRAWG